MWDSAGVIASNDPPTWDSSTLSPADPIWRFIRLARYSASDSSSTTTLLLLCELPGTEGVDNVAMSPDEIFPLTPGLALANCDGGEGWSWFVATA